MAKQLAAELKKNEPRFQQLMQDELVRLLQYKDKYSFKDPRFPVYQQYRCEDLACAKTKINQLLESCTWFRNIALCFQNNSNEVNSAYGLNSHFTDYFVPALF